VETVSIKVAKVDGRYTEVPPDWHEGTTLHVHPAQLAWYRAALNGYFSATEWLNREVINAENTPSNS